MTSVITKKSRARRLVAQPPAPTPTLVVPKALAYKPRYISRAPVRRLLLELAKQNKAHKFTRVSNEVYAALDARIAQIALAWVKAQPSRGRTIVPPFVVS